MLNQQEIQSNWPKVKAGILEHWGKLSEVEVENAKNSVSSITQLVQSQYGKNEDVEGELEKICMECVTFEPATDAEPIEKPIQRS